MSAQAFEDLESIYPQVLEHMKQEFDSHDFILKLANEHQQLYVQALNAYANNDQPFQSVHKEIAMLLYNFPELVSSTGKKRNSENIFRKYNLAEVWWKVKS